MTFVLSCLLVGCQAAEQSAGESPVASRAEKLASGGCVAATSSGRTYQFCQEPVQWAEAVQFCDALDLTLVSINSATENTFVRNQLSTDAWLGGSDREHETHWFWQENGDEFWEGTSSGTVHGYASWTTGRPGNDTARNCTRFVDSSGKWTDVACNTALPFVCEPLAGAQPTPNPPPSGLTHFLILEAPQPLTITDVAISGSSKVDVGHEAVVRDQLAGHAPIASLGDPLASGAPTYAIELNGTVGDVYARGRVELEDDAVVRGSVRSGRNVSVDDDAEVTGAVVQNTTVAVNRSVRGVTFPANPGSDIDVSSSQPRTLDPGNYDEIEVHVNARLTLNPGTYYLNSFDVEAGSIVTFKNASAPVIIYIRSNFEYDGRFNEEATGDQQGNALIAYFGSGTVHLDEPFTGTLVAPKAKIWLDDESKPHVGAFFAKEVEMDGHSTIIHAPYKGWLIPTVTVSNSSPCRNEPVLFTASVDGLAADDTAIEVSIDGEQGTRRQIQFLGPGTYKIQVSAFQGTLASTRIIPITVRDCPNQQYARVVTAASPYAPYEIELAVKNATEITGPNRKFVWAFGDGTTQTTDYPFVTHSYESKLSATQVEQTFDAQLTVTRDGMPNLVTPKTITITNLYALNRSRGYARPPLVITQDLEHISRYWSGTYRIQNLEPAPLSLTGQLIERHFCDPDMDPVTSANTPISLTVPANGTLEEAAHFLITDYGTNVCGISMYLSGSTAGGIPVRVAVHFKTPVDPMLTTPVTETVVLDLLNDVAAQGLVADPNHITGEELERLHQQGRISFVPTTENIDNGALQEFVDVIGERCYPDDTPPMGGIGCQPTDEWTVAPPYVRNALKGDLIIVASCGEIGQLLRNVTPRQLYSHEAIMTRNYYALAHSTGEKGRIIATVKGAGDILGEDELKYTWPGSVATSVAAGFRDGTVLINPEGGLNRVRGFAAPATECEGDGKPNPPIVIRPGPGATPGIRAQLHLAADFAATAQSHYRWFGYTRANIAFDGADNWDGGDYRGADWAEGLPATVSTTFIWWALKSVGTNLEGPTLEDSDRAPRFRAELPVGGGITDGLYFYSESERRDAGQYLFNATKNGVLDTQWNSGGPLGSIAEFFTAQSDQIAAQFVNCFAIDDCGDPYIENPDWPECGGDQGSCPQLVINFSYQNPGIGVTVSPDDFLLWDAPETGGHYGDSEPMRYRSADYTRVHRWVAVEGTGQVTGRVELEDGTPVDGMNVVIAGQNMFSQDGGQFAFRGLDAGEHVITADGLVGGQPLEALEVITIVDGATTEVTLVLAPETAVPPPTLEVFPRKLEFTGTAHVVDDELAKNEWGDFSIAGECEVSPLNRDVTAIIKGVAIIGGNKADDDLRIRQDGDLCVGDEVRVHLTATCTLETDNTTVTVSARAELFEKDDCGDKEKNGDKATDPVAVAAGDDFQADFTVRNTAEGGDRADIVLDAVNAQGDEPVVLPNVQPKNMRIVRVGGTVFIKDDDWPDPDDSKTFPFVAECLVDPFDREATETWSACHKEVKISIEIKCTLSPEDHTSVNTEWKVVMYEGTSCLTDDKDGTQSRAFFLSEGESQHVELSVKNTEEDAPDRGSIDVIVTNEQRE